MRNDEIKMRTSDVELRTSNAEFDARRFDSPRRSRIHVRRGTFAVLIVASGWMIGCVDTRPPAPPPQPPPELVSASDALANNQPDNAISSARAFLLNQPTGPLAAEALYLEGRGNEQRIPADAADRSRNLNEARSCYLLALQQSPGKPLEGDVYTSLASVSFQVDDYANCVQYATTAMSLLDPKNPSQADLLYLIGRSKQRLEVFTDADQIFRQVQQRYPNTEDAAAAKSAQGQRKFYVQVSTYGTQALADRATALLGSRGFVVSQRTDSKGQTVVDVGSYDTFATAKAARDQLQGEFPTVVIVP